ncbi:MAG: transcriptional repressor [Prevotellaceae bacterium]|jgi:Fe2+ or Zn2+ uptake regulation protein|nr:transcriptional repressor [Prevotellaceae bacterium]
MDKKRRNTKAKHLITSVLENSNSALCHEDIEKQIPEKMDRVTIYRVLQGFCDSGKVHKIISEDGKTYYALCHNCTEEKHQDNHPHFHCIACDTITCIEEPVAPQTLPHGYSAVVVASYISGYCQKCSSLMKTVLLFVLVFAGQNDF